ncbi:hypothetical protein [Natrinema sp. HArc-T2]|uniref:hypothetical protein n=1 Tax=Natrinema sp. HArc-T2 TaxID=3242701 RepID=UPI00359D3577
MKRTITIALAVAMIASIALAGTAAAGGADHGDHGGAGDISLQDADTRVVQDSQGRQVNINDQDAAVYQNGTASVEGGDGGAVTVSVSENATGDVFAPGSGSRNAETQGQSVPGMPFDGQATENGTTITVDSSGGSVDNASATVNNDAQVIQRADQSNNKEQVANAAAANLRNLAIFG